MRCVLTAVLALSLTTVLGAQTTWYVDAGACGPIADGTAKNPFCTIQDAVDAASSGDTVLIGAGLYKQDVVMPGSQLRLVGMEGATATKLEAQEIGAIFVSPGADVRMEGLGFSDRWGIVSTDARVEIVRCRFVRCFGYDFEGGAITATGSDLIITNSLFEENESLYGGSIYADGGSARIEGCNFLYGDAYDGGGLFLQGMDEVTIAHCRFHRMHAEKNGSAMIVSGERVLMEDSLFTGNGVWDYGGTALIGGTYTTIRRCSFLENGTAHGSAGALSAGGVELWISDCEFIRNGAAEGGALLGWATRGVVERCYFEGNLSSAGSYPGETGLGGAILTSSRLRIERCAFVSNIATGNSGWGPDGQGGAIYGPVDAYNCTFYRNQAIGRYAGEPTGGAVAGGATLNDCIVWKNVPDQLDASSAARWSDVQGGWGGIGNFNAPPYFVDPDRGDLRLRPSSPCIDAGDPALMDPDGSRLDVGAFPFSRSPLRGGGSSAMPGNL